MSFDLLVIDDFGLMQLDLNKCRNLFEVLESRDPGRSTMVISQFPVSTWYDLFQEHTYADACLNRLLCHSNFFPHFYPELKGVVGPHMFGYNKQQHMTHFILHIPACAVLAWVCMLF